MLIYAYISINNIQWNRRFIEWIGSSLLTWNYQTHSFWRHIQYCVMKHLSGAVAGRTRPTISPAQLATSSAAGKSHRGFGPLGLGLHATSRTSACIRLSPSPLSLPYDESCSAARGVTPTLSLPPFRICALFRPLLWGEFP